MRLDEWKDGYSDEVRSKYQCRRSRPDPDDDLFTIPTTIAGVPPPETLGRNPRRRVQSEEDQKYIVKLLTRHADDFKVGLACLCLCLVVAGWCVVYVILIGRHWR